MVNIKHIYWASRYGKWHIGFQSRKTWHGKPYFGLYSDYYDGFHFCFHLGYFYIGASEFYGN